MGSEFYQMVLIRTVLSYFMFYVDILKSLIENRFVSICKAEYNSLNFINLLKFRYFVNRYDSNLKRSFFDQENVEEFVDKLIGNEKINDQFGRNVSKNLNNGQIHLRKEINNERNKKKFRITKQIISQQNYIMKGSTFLKDDDVFEVLLSNEDYLELKEWKDKYNRLQIKLGEFEALSAEIITLKLALSQAQLQKTETQKSNQELKNVIGLISQCLNVKIEALLAQDKQSVPSKQGICSIKEKNHELRKNFTESQLTSQINELCEVYESRLKKQRQKSISITSQNTTLRNEVKNLEVQTVLLKNENRNTSLKVSELTRIKVEEGQNTSDRIQKIQSSLKNLSEENSALKKQLTQVQNKLANLSIQNQLLSEQNNQYCKETRELQDQIKQYQQHIRILKQSIQHQSKSKNHHITQKRYSPKRVEAQSPEKSKFQKQDYIKQTLIEYSRQIRKNLLKIGNLSQEEIKQIGASELDVLVKFIKELEEDFD